MRPAICTLVKEISACQLMGQGQTPTGGMPSGCNARSAALPDQAQYASRVPLALSSPP